MNPIRRARSRTRKQDQEQEGSSAQETQISEITLASLYESIKNMSEAFSIRLTTIETQQRHFEQRQECNPGS